MKLNKAYLKCRLKELKLTFQYYSLLPRKVKNSPAVIIMFDSKMMHGGLVDRLKGIISAAIIAKELDYEFNIFTADDFPLKKFLLLHQQPYADQKRLVYNWWVCKPLVLYNLPIKNRHEIFARFSPHRKQYHLYCNTNVLKAFYPSLNQNELDAYWRETFWNIFSFDNYFDNFYNTYFNIKDNVGGIHLRFISLLGDFKEVNDTPLPEAEKKVLIEKCLKQVSIIMQENLHSSYLLVADSKYFLDVAKEHFCDEYKTKKLIVLDGKIGHIDINHSEEILRKAVLDFYLLTRCKNVYQVLGNKMYGSQFAKYAAVTGGAGYKVCNVNY